MEYVYINNTDTLVKSRPIPTETHEILWSYPTPNGFCFSINLLADENECLTDNGGCQQTCINLEGSHQCSCRELHTLADDGRACLRK